MVRNVCVAVKKVGMGVRVGYGDGINGTMMGCDRSSMEHLLNSTMWIEDLLHNMYCARLNTPQ